ncbi:MAG: starch synthase [Desulfobacteraceae bacterium 4572_35.1]|nr:MAG: starch synthase [Desulfobacteraceae bacterium 4572_35.1]
MKILFASSEIYPLVKTGGLADVSAGLPAALGELGQEVVLIMPAYAAALEVIPPPQLLYSGVVSGCGRQRTVRVLSADIGGIEPLAGCSMLLVEIEDLFDRSGGPYQNGAGDVWPDNGERFGLFAQIVADVAMDRCGLDWKADVVHANDWQTGLVPALLSLEQSQQRPKSVFTIHNLSYGGHFPHELFVGLNLPQQWWHFNALEFYGSMSMLKGGIVFADYVTTVSPSYAVEICSPEYGFGLHDTLRQRRDGGRLLGILNGIDSRVWNPEYDHYLPFNYSAKRGRVAQKKRNKQALLQRFGAEVAGDVLSAPLIGYVGRMVEQKGVDLILEVIPRLVRQSDSCFVMVGTGMAEFEQQFLELAHKFPQRVFVSVGYVEELAHLVEAGSDMFLMPSRFEPCGLNQMYSLVYGTPPVVHGTGGLRDTVVDSDDAAIAAGTATGFVFTGLDAQTLYRTVLRALDTYKRPRRWQALQKNGMLQNFGWQRSAQTYMELYYQATH